MSDCFIIMPITTPKHLVGLYSGGADHFEHVLNHLFIPAIKKVGLNPIKPIAEGSDIIHARIIENIEKTDLILCDMSTLNPNVFFELGIRTAVDKPVCMVKDDATEKVPFDTSIINYHTYNESLTPWTLEKEVEALSDHLKAVVDSGGKNSLWHYFGLSSKAKFSEEDTGVEGKVDLISLRIEGLTKLIKQQSQNIIQIPESAKSEFSDIFGDEPEEGVWSPSVQYTTGDSSKKYAQVISVDEAKYTRHQKNVKVFFDLSVDLKEVPNGSALAIELPFIVDSRNIYEFKVRQTGLNHSEDLTVSARRGNYWFDLLFVTDGSEGSVRFWGYIAYDCTLI